MSKKFDYDFAGWATRNDIVCADGRTIKRDAFIGDDGVIVPLVYQHNHKDITNVLGHALLQNRPEGVYMYGKFNDTYEGQHAKTSVQNGDIKSLSIYANELKHAQGKNVVHGSIKEVSLVIAPANPQATIEYVSMEHSENGDGDEAIICSGFQDLVLNLEGGPTEIDDVLSHAEEPKQKEEPKQMANAENKTIQDVLDTLNEEQKAAVQAAIGYAVEHAAEIKKAAGGGEEESGEAKHSDEGGTDFMNHNVFEAPENDAYTLSHAEQAQILNEAKKGGMTFRAALDNYCETTLQHGIGRT